LSLLIHLDSLARQVVQLFIHVIGERFPCFADQAVNRVLPDFGHAGASPIGIPSQSAIRKLPVLRVFRFGHSVDTGDYDAHGLRCIFLVHCALRREDSVRQTTDKTGKTTDLKDLKHLSRAEFFQKRGGDFRGHPTRPVNCGAPDFRVDGRQQFPAFCFPRATSGFLVVLYPLAVGDDE
jgi:hypothetical protein